MQQTWWIVETRYGWDVAYRDDCGGIPVVRESAYAELEQENERLREELADTKEDAFYEAALKVPVGDLAGWWDTTARSSVMELGEELVQLGRLERHPHGTGRRWFYRPVTK